MMRLITMGLQVVSMLCVSGWVYAHYDFYTASTAFIALQLLTPGGPLDTRV